MPAPVLDVPEVCAGDVGDVHGCDFAQEDGCEEGRDEGYAGSGLVGFGVLLVEAEDLGSAEALGVVSEYLLRRETTITYVMCLAPRSFSEVLRVVQCRIERLDLLLCTCILPIGTERVTERALPLTLRTAFKLLE